MKTIVLTISRGSIARMFLQNDFYRILRERRRIVILTPAYQNERFIKEFAHPNVSFAPLEEIKWGRMDNWVYNASRLLIWNPSVDVRIRYGIFSDEKVRPRPVYYAVKGIALALRRFRFLRDWLRAFDARFLQKDVVRQYRALLERERADFVLSTNPVGVEEAALLKAARELGIRHWVIPKSWDNFPKSGLRAKGERVAAWNLQTKDEAMRYQNYAASDVDVIGMMHYDDLLDPGRRWDRAEFCRAYGLSPDRKIILFGSGGKYFRHDSDIAMMLVEMIEKNELAEPCTLLIRPHFGFHADEKKYLHLVGRAHIAVDLFHQPPEGGFKDNWDYSDAFTERWVNSIAHASVIIGTHSSLSVDAAALDKPAISIAFDGLAKDLPYEKSVIRTYVDYYRNVVETGGTRMVYGRDELRAAVNAYLRDPGQDREGRKKLRERYAEPLDGKAGQRLADLLFNATL
ncbi:MAG: hypothetical protein AAB539_02450 [Patescibacteria group bacterium]